jgi:hypothetical protein
MPYSTILGTYVRETIQQPRYLHQMRSDRAKV